MTFLFNVKGVDICAISKSSNASFFGGARKIHIFIVYTFLHFKKWHKCTLYKYKSIRLFNYV